ncbi:BMP family ABC transporter substrate-binding protein [Evansella clarkii]|uniref:BMP family ABC transporter substrate-binding protein n=1 Tax=Evansella clarkii TaxID=79879 RepID=UPI000B433F48|nr:BMP family ABC transporter substrate-binding protein [Evansella clarkii]
MKYWIIYCLSVILMAGGCAGTSVGAPEKAALLLPHPIDDQGWNSKGYQGILNTQANLGMEIFVREDINRREDILSAIDEFAEDDVRLIFGHSITYADLFMEVKDDYPSVHFVSFNGEVEGENITSLHFEGYAMGYFAGMLAGEMTETNKLGVIAAFPFQPEIQGFEEGARFQNPDVEVDTQYMESWIDEGKAIKAFNDMEKAGTDVFYPAGDGFHIAVIEEVKNAGLYAIGYVSDQIDLGETTVLTSTVQHVDRLYEFVAGKYLNGELDGGNKYFDFDDGVISLGQFSPEVPEQAVLMIEDAVESYIDTGLLPHEINSQ